jgi:peptidoglycan/LPS O-acetylase OafA/YrhL
MPHSTPKPGFRPDIQGLRAIAVLAVLGYHVGVPAFGGGYLGVDLFFVISGYLIGGHIVREILATGRLNFTAFYTRRARRILPASLAVIALTMLASLVWAPPLRAPEVAFDALWATLSAANLRFAVQGTDYLAGTTPSPLQHYWSLGVEEQFYILVPLLLIGMFVVLRSHPRALYVVGALLTVASFALCLAWGTSSPWTYFALPARAWELGVGVLIAVIAFRTSQLSTLARQLVATAGAVTLAASAWWGSIPGFEHPGIGTLLPVLATAAIILAGERAESPATLTRSAPPAPLAHPAPPARFENRMPLVNRALGIRPAQFIGTLSFSLYLVHWPVLALARENSNSDQPLPLATGLALAALSFPLAWLLWRFVEQPFLRTRTVAGRERRPLMIAGVTTVALVIALAVAVPVLANRPLTSDLLANTGSELLPAGTAYVPRNIQPLLGNAAADTGELYRNGCQQSTTASELTVCSFGPADGATVVLFGDSHAGRWFPALAAAFDGQPVHLVTLTKSGCRSLESEELWAGARNRSCATWRESAVNWLAENPPELLVLADHVGRSTESAARTEARWRDATASTVARFPAGVPIAILAETPEFSFSPPVCLSQNLTNAAECSEDRSVAVNTSVIAGVRAGAGLAGATFVDLTDWFCDTARCPTVIGSSLVYTDEHHLSATFSATLGDAVYAALTPLIATPSPPR